MKLYLNELAPWERKQEYYHTIQLGKDVKEQTIVLNKQTKALIASQLGSANAVIASQDRISEGIDAVAFGVGRVEQGMFELKSAFEWGISEVVWQIEQNRVVLKTILEVLMSPLDPQAKERRIRAENAFSNGWIEDAEEEFLESEKLNKFDFSIHISLGMIYLFHKIDKEKSLSYFENAIKYSKPKSAFHTSYALLHKALIHFDMGSAEKAEKASGEAIRLSPDFTEALYQNAQYNAQLLKATKSISNLEEAIRVDRLYCLKAAKDPMFDPIRNEVNQLFKKLKINELDRCNKGLRNLYFFIKQYQDVIDNINLSLKDFNKEITEIKKIIERDSYFDIFDARVKLTTLASTVKDYFNEIENDVDIQITRADVDIQNINRKAVAVTNRLKTRIVKIGSTIGIIASILLAFRGFMEYKSGSVDGPVVFIALIIFISISIAGSFLIIFIIKQITNVLLSNEKITDISKINEINRVKKGFINARNKLRQTSSNLFNIVTV